MHIARTLAATLSLAYLAASTEIDTDLTKRGWDDSTADLVERQAPAPNGERVVQIVTVSNANGTLKFFPENVKADVGSVVQFQFYPKNHTVTESSFAAPCKPIASNLTSAMHPGQKSGFVPVAADAQFRPVYNLIVNDTKPIWIYCGQTPHCQKGMSMVINENTASGNTLAKYQAAAAMLPIPAAAGGSSSAGSSASMAATGGAKTMSMSSASMAATGGAMTMSMSMSMPMSSASSAGPSLSGTVTSAAPQSTSSTAIAPFKGGAGMQQSLSAWSFLAPGFVWALL